MSPKKFGAGLKKSDTKPLNTKGVWEPKGSKVGVAVEPRPNEKKVEVAQTKGQKPVKAAITEPVETTAALVITSDEQIVSEQSDASALMKELYRAESVVQAALTSGNLDELFAYGNLLNSVEGVAGVSKMRFLYLLEARWPEFRAKKLVEDDVQNVAAAHFKITPSNFKKYTRAWAKLYEGRLIPDVMRGAWLSKPIEHWLRITAAAIAGLSKAQWQKATTARYGREIADIAKSVRGSKTSAKTRLTIQLRRNTGELRAWRGSSKPETIGTLKTSAKDLKNQTISDAIARIISAVGIVEE